MLDRPLAELTAEHQTCECRAFVLGPGHFEWNLLSVGEDEEDIFDNYLIGRPLPIDVMEAAADYANGLGDEINLGQITVARFPWDDDLDCWVASVMTPAEVPA